LWYYFTHCYCGTISHTGIYGCASHRWIDGSVLHPGIYDIISQFGIS
jgi:hypothetical protein